ncbi:glutaredoxin domain-containing protein [Tropicimonas sp. IMCC6043]|uniref:glutaredoxin domain-containing protein n=1 Tax=Tropicimonas sp. IMCC6043 TaxID=2510645 RepID=UPI002110E2B5|nr:glutaredoxin domain-containing protein [Tropicimonas sp. IMCC6043]
MIFALEWCEFSWSVRNMFAEAGIPYLSVDLDSAAFQKDNKGTRYRAALREITRAPTIPQIFVAGSHIGGATETFDAFNSGKLQAALNSVSVAFDADMTRDAYSFLPGWLHPR